MEINDSSSVLTFYETKIHIYIIAVVLLALTLNPFGFQTYLFILPIIMLVVAFVYPSAKIILYPDHFYYKKGFNKISIKYNEIIAIHQDPVVTTNLLSLYLSNKFRMGGFFIETTKGFTKYIGSVSQNRFSFKIFDRRKLFEEISKRSSAKVGTGQVSIFKQRQKLWDVVLLLSSIFIVPAVIIFIYWIFFGLV